MTLAIKRPITSGFALAKSFTWNDSVWNPRMLNGLALWLDASDATTITASGGLISQINDKSGNGRNFLASGAARPTLTSNALNSLAVITFGGTQRLVSQAAAATWKFLHDGTTYTIAGVFKAGNSSDPDALYGLLGSNGGASAQVGCIFGFDDRSSVGRNNALVSWLSMGTGFAVQSTTNNFALANAPQIWSASLAPSASPASDRAAVAANGGTETKNNSNTPAPSQSNPFFNLQIGDSGEGNFPMVGYHAEIIITSPAQSLSARQSTEGYLAHKWGLAASLPSDHPYKTTPPLP